MRYLFLLFVLIANVFTAKAQAPNFDETVKYINDFLEENPTITFDVGYPGAYSINAMKAKKDGTVIFLWKNRTEQNEQVVGSFNLHNIKHYEYSGRNPNGTSRLHLYFTDPISSTESAYFGSSITKEMSDKLEKMLKHLESLSTEKNPFNN